MYSMAQDVHFSSVIGFPGWIFCVNKSTTMGALQSMQVMFGLIRDTGGRPICGIPDRFIVGIPGILGMPIIPDMFDMFGILVMLCMFGMPGIPWNDRFCICGNCCIGGIDMTFCIWLKFCIPPMGCSIDRLGMLGWLGKMDTELELLDDDAGVPTGMRF
jgi:hypothetical protein